MKTVIINATETATFEYMFEVEDDFDVADNDAGERLVRYGTPSASGIIDRANDVEVLGMEDAA